MKDNRYTAEELDSANHIDINLEDRIILENLVEGIVKLNLETLSPWEREFIEQRYGLSKYASDGTRSFRFLAIRYHKSHVWLSKLHKQIVNKLRKNFV